MTIEREETAPTTSEVEPVMSDSGFLDADADDTNTEPQGVDFSDTSVSAASSSATSAGAGAVQADVPGGGTSKTLVWL